MRNIADDVSLGDNVVIRDFVNLYGCEIGDESRIGPFVEIQKGVRIGPRCKISSHTFICEGVTLEEGVFIGHGVMFTNDRHPRAVSADGSPLGSAEWKLEPTLVRSRASIGSGSVILPAVTIGARSIVGSGSVVTRDVPEGAVVYGNPARVMRGDER